MAHPSTCPAPAEVQRWTRTLIPTAREAPADAETPSHILLSRAGFIRKVAAGVYDYLPMATRVLAKISAIVREEMNAAGAAELLMPVIVPFEFYRETKRDEAYGELLFRVKDRKGNLAALGPTHEETITEMVKGSVTSYKQLPLNLYQIQTKFRDEARPRAGLLRCREFVMKDAYSFHLNVEGPGGLNETYDAMHRAYSNALRRCGLDFTPVEAESGPIGGSASHEFMVNCASGEDTVLRCPDSGYAANVEKCEIGERAWSFGEGGGGEAPPVKVHTPGLPGIDEVAAFLKIQPGAMLKTIVFRATDGVWVLAVVRGDHEVNEGKVKSASGRPAVLADEKTARAAGFQIGYVSPTAALRIPDVLVLIDPDAATPGAWATGADEKDHHLTGFRWRASLGDRLFDSRYVKIADIRNALPGDPSPRAAGARLIATRGIEVGHIFKLGTKYSDAMGFTILDANQKKQAVIMGCYGMGISRTMAACVEMSHDADGIIWPAAIAPYQVLITCLKPQHVEMAVGLAMEIAAKGGDVLIDDRDERPGVKFKDADLVGFPVRITLGDKSLAEGSVELKFRARPGKGELVRVGDAVNACLAGLKP